SWTDDVVVRELEREMGIVLRAHGLMQLFSRPDAHHLNRHAGRHGQRDIGDPRRWDLRHEDFSAPHALEIPEYETDSLVERDPEPGHTLIGDWQLAAADAQDLAEPLHK